MGEMQLAANAMQIVGADMIGLFVPSHNGNRYVLIDYSTGCAEAFPLKDKSNASVWQAWATHVVLRHGTPEVLIMDNGQEFKATAWRTYLTQLGVGHSTTTSVHPQSNGRIERFNRTFQIGKIVVVTVLRHRAGASVTSRAIHPSFYFMGAGLEHC